MNVLDDLRLCVQQAATMEPTEGDPELHGFLAEAKGVIHVGANVGEERSLYAAFGLPVLWIEPIPLVFETLCANIRNYSGQWAVRALVADHSGKKYKFGLASNACQSSSIFDFAAHKELWPDVGYIDAMELESTTLAKLIQEWRLDLKKYDTLVLDVQGAELLALKGAGDYANRFRWILTEAADFQAYRGGCQLRDIDDYLLPRGFVRQKTLEFFSGPPGHYFNVLYKGAA